ncbi:FtsX-like permease family protein [Paenibacillus sp.]|uniref:ABC transporter permease n=1 Tax=Paenibacillus sp. TaxID=58172 RepID=UPI0028123567|nr:FtsX-like permease family protein [Paenibacillus sp.]
MFYAVATSFSALLFLYVVHRLSRYPHLRRMAWRNLWSQKHTALLTALGLTASTSLIAMTLLANASMNRSAELNVERHYGNIAYDMPSTDQASLDGSLFDRADAERIAAGRPGGVLPIVSYNGTAVVKNDRQQNLLVVPNMHVIGVDAPDAVRFEPSLEAVLAGERPASDELLFSESAAAALDVEAGDVVYILDRGNAEHAFAVKRVVPERGVTGYVGIHRGKAAILAHPDAVRRLAGLEGVGYTNLLLSDAGPHGWKAVPVRSDALSQYKDATAFISAVFGVTSMNAVLIGLVLITNIFKMIAEERRQEMGILRAIGLGKRDLKLLLRAEGLLYGLFSSVIGVAVGLGLAYFLTSTVGRIMVETFSDGASGTFRFHLVPGAMAAACSIGLFMVFACVWTISHKAVKFSVVEALQAPDPAKQAGRPKSLFDLWLLVLSGVLAASVVIVTAVPGIRREFITEDRVGPVLLFTLGSVPLFVFVLAQGLPYLSEGLLRLFRRSASLTFVLRLAFRNMNANRTRTGLILLMFAAISCFCSFPLVYEEAVGAMLSRSDPRTAAGGYDLLARDARVLVTEDVERRLQRSSEIGGRDGYRVAAVRQLLWKEEQGEWGPFPLKANGIDRAFAETNDIPLWRKDASFANDREAWLALAEDEDAVIVSEEALNYERGAPYDVGEPFRIRIGEKEATKRIVAVAAAAGYHPESFGVWMSAEALTALAKGEEELHSTLFVKLAKPDKELERALTKALTLQNISPVINVVASEKGYYRTAGYLIRLFLGFNQLALAIGMTGLLVVMYRLVRQRKQQIGMLRALGVPASKIYWVVLLEGACIGALGIALGYSIGTYMSYIVFDTLMANDVGNELRLPYGTLAAYFAGTLAVALALSCLPARGALRVPPSEATRYAG